MNEIVQMVAQKTGIGEDKARQAVQVVVEQLRSRLPGPLASHLDSFVGGGSGQDQQNSGLGGLGGILNKAS
jgi:hypothetical protein